MKEIATIGAIVILATIVGVAIIVGIDRSERVECKKWQSQAEQYSNFYLIKWQDQQCRTHNIIINAQVQ